MEALGNTLGEEGPFVSVWVGLFGSREVVEAYTLEQYDDDVDHEPISPFAADVGLRFYDHDFFEVGHEPGLSARGAGAFTLHSYGASFAAKAWGAVERIGNDPFDTVFLLYGYDHHRSPQAARRPRRVTFVGTFPYQE
jgi:immunity protein 22 of polymorphic toxin system